MNVVSFHKRFSGIFPATVSRAALEDDRAVIPATLQGAPVICVYCHQNQAFAFWMTHGARGAGFWTSFAPLAYREMLEFLATQGFEFHEREMHQWLAHVSGEKGSNQ